MAQATILSIGKSKSNPPAHGATDDKTGTDAKLASAFRGMESDLNDLLQMARLESRTIEDVLGGGPGCVTTDENGKRWMVVEMDEIEMTSFASFELCRRVEELYATYHRVFKII